MNRLQVSMLKESCYVIALCMLIPSLPAHAGTPPDEWWSGDWTCDIGGRPAQMKWAIVEDSKVPDSRDGAGRATPAVLWEGSYSDNGSQWVALSDPSKGKKGGLYFRHADGNKWYLQKPTENKTTGWTTATAQRNAPRHPISCWK